MMTAKLPRAFVLGLDGVPWPLLDTWISEGELPHFERLVAEGAAGPLESTRPANTPIAWSSIVTGTRADQHGIYEFTQLKPSYGHRPSQASDRRRPALWDVLTPAVVVNVPMTYPPAPIDGTLVTGMMTPDLESTFTHPPELSAEIRQRFPDYDIGLDWASYADRRAAFAADLDRLVAARRSLMRYLLEDDGWRLSFFVYTAPDRLQHLDWDESRLLAFYRTIDDIVGEVTALCEERDCPLFVVSDHGFGPVQRYVYVNTVLERAGYLARREERGLRGLLSRVGFTKDRVMDLVHRVGLSDRQLVHLLPSGLVDGAATRIPGSHGLYDLDYGSTRAFLHGMGSLYVNDTVRFDQGTVEPEAVEGVKRSVMELLADVVDPVTGERVLDVHDGDVVYPRDARAPDVVVTAREGYRVRSGLHDDPFSEAAPRAAEHRPEGVFLAWGPHIRAGERLEGLSVYDVAPTVLHACGEPVMAGGDGTVQRAVFDPGSPPDRRPVSERSYVGTTAAERDDDLGSVEQRLRGLGYLE